MLYNSDACPLSALNHRRPRFTMMSDQFFSRFSTTFVLVSFSVIWFNGLVLGQLEHSKHIGRRISLKWGLRVRKGFGARSIARKVLTDWFATQIFLQKQLLSATAAQRKIADHLWNYQLHQWEESMFSWESVPWNAPWCPSAKPGSIPTYCSATYPSTSRT